MSLDTRPDLSEPDLPDAEADPGRDVSVGDLFGRVYALFHNKRFGLALILALGFLTLLGVLFVQAPDDVLADPELMASWLDGVRAKYRGWTDILAAVGVFSVFSSVWFKGVTVLLALSILACTTHRLPQLLRQANRPHVRVRDTFFDHARFRAATTLDAGLDDATALVKQRLHGKRFRTITDADGPTTLVYADRHRFAPFGTVVAHLAFIVILAGVFVTSTFGLRIPEFTVAVGSVAEVGHGTGLSVEARSFTDTYNADGSPADYASDLVLFSDGVQVAQQVVRVNAPLRWGGYSINQSYFGIAADLEVRDAAGAVVFSGAIPLQYRTSDDKYAYGRVTLATQKLLVYVITPASGQVVDDIGAGQAQLEVYAEGADKPTFQQLLTPGKPVTQAGLTWTFVRERQFTGLMVSRDPGAFWVWLGCALLALGTCWTMFYRHHRVWVQLVPDGRVTRVTLASPDRHDSAFEARFERFVAGLSDSPATSATPATPAKR